MNKIMLTIIAICVIIPIIGCKNGNLNNVDTKKSIDNNISQMSGEEKKFLFSGDLERESVLLKPQDEVYKYNESGKIIIAMYHKFSEVETDEFCRSFDNFKKDLEYLYALGYRTISLNDYLNNNIKVPIGCTPIILTFDDGSNGQFNLIKSGDKLVANPNSAVGIMEKFYEEHPDFGLNGTFYINGTNIFTGEGTVKERLDYLINEGFEIGNHTNTHVNFSKASIEEIQKEIGIVNNMVKSLTGYQMNSLALPYGINSKNNKEYIHKGSCDSVEYENKIILLVGAEPASSPNSENVNLLSLPRVRASGGNKRIDFDLYYWLEKMEETPSMKYVRLHNEDVDSHNGDVH
ncbi:MAG: polysaccharide deacetylase family protein [Clostridia bacterium]|nr:polysaccharide deacetylase family protein [Clostridia bacterium]